MPGSGRGARARASRGGDPGPGAWEAAGAPAAAEPRVPAPGGCPRDQGGDPARQAGQALSPGGWGARAGGKLVPRSSGGCACSALGPPPLRTVPARVASQGPAAPGGRRGVGEGGWPGAGGRGLEAGAGSAAASAARSQCGKLRRWRTRQETLPPSRRNSKTNGSQDPAPARLQPSPPPASPRQPRPLATASSRGSPGRLRGAGARTQRRVLPPLPPPPPAPRRRRLSLPCQRWPP